MNPNKRPNKRPLKYVKRLERLQAQNCVECPEHHMWYKMFEETARKARMEYELSEMNKKAKLDAFIHNICAHPFSGVDIYEEIVERQQDCEEGELLPDWAVEYMSWINSLVLKT